MIGNWIHQLGQRAQSLHPSQGGEPQGAARWLEQQDGRQEQHNPMQQRWQGSSPASTAEEIPRICTAKLHIGRRIFGKGPNWQTKQL